MFLFLLNLERGLFYVFCVRTFKIIIKIKLSYFKFYQT